MNRARPLAGAILIALLFSLTAPPLADAQGANPYETRAAELAAEVQRAGRSPRAMLPLLQLWRGWNDTRSEVTLGHLERIAADRRLSTPVRSYAAQLVARARTRRGDPDASRREIDALGYIRSWSVVGPFDNEGKQGFDREYEPETTRMEARDAEARYPGRERPVGWRVFPDVSQFGYISFDAIYRPDTNVCAYAETWVTSDRAQALSLWVGAGGAVRAWWNGTEVLEDARYRQPDPDRLVAVVGAHQGLNRLLIEDCVAGSTWGFFARLADATGAAPRGLSYAATGDATQVHAGHGVARLPAVPEAPLAFFEAQAAGDSPSAQALEDLARFLAYTGADDPAEQRAKELAARAAEAEATVPRLVLAAELATERGESTRFVDRAIALAPDDPRALLARARIVTTGASPEAALPMLAQIPESTVQGMDAVVLRAQLLDDLGMEESARALIERTAERAPGTPRWTSLRAHYASVTERSDRAMELRRELVALRYDDQVVRRLIISDALVRADVDEALRNLEIYQRLGADHVSVHLTVASVYDAIGRSDEAMGAYRAAIELAPEEADARVAYGRALLREGQQQAGADVLREALALRPQDAETRELLESFAPEARADEQYAEGQEQILARANGGGAGFPVRILANLTVNTVFESGLGSSFHQVAAQIVDEEGARDFRTYPIQFDPDVQRVQVRMARVYRNGRILEGVSTFEQQLGEPWYRIYYDTRALVVVFPDLEPGDVVELRWRIDDVAERNLFDDYYGDLHYLQSTTPIARMDYVLITPASRQFFFNEPRIESLVHEQRVEGNRRIDHFHVENVPAIPPEDDRPGMTEIAPYLHVSTYQTWQDVGRWWLGLVRDQLYADESLRRTVADLMRGVPETDTRERVRRIYDWVIRNTRYVGLEFGIHGFLPYRVPQIVQRGFGDCKDKASLIYTMLREAGVDARIVLVRTRRNGAITDLPASLSVFDHAIAYVPSLDLFLDGTAEAHGIDDLPPMDQGVTVLVVGPDSAELRTTPVLPSDHDRRTRQITIELAAGGSARVTSEEEVRGSEAPGYRSHYESEGTRRDRFEQRLRSLFPGVEVSRVTFENLDDFGAPVRYRYEAQVPQIAVTDADGLRIGGTVLDDLTRTFARTDTRRFPLDLGQRSSYVEERTIRMPAGFSAGTVPEGGEAISPYGRLVMQVTHEGREIRVRTELAIERDVIPVAEYGAFRSWVESADRILRQRIVLTGGAR